MDHGIDLRDEPIDETVQRMSDFLWILKYKSNVADPFIFRNGLLNGDKSITLISYFFFLFTYNNIFSLSLLALYFYAYLRYNLSDFILELTKDT